MTMFKVITVFKDKKLVFRRKAENREIVKEEVQDRLKELNMTEYRIIYIEELR